MKYGIGIDIGGTKISIILGTEKGKILSYRKIDTLKHRRIPICMQNLIQTLQEMIKESGLSRSQIRGIGIGIPGAVNDKLGIVPNSPNLQGWNKYPIKRFLQKNFRLPVRMTNDANAAVVAEKIFGYGKSARHLIYMTVSTGVGGGIMINNQLVEGANYVAGEIGHMVIVPNGRQCNCGQKGCLEAYASGTAIARYVEKEIRHGRGAGIQRFLGKKKGLAAREIGQAAKKKDRLAIEAYRYAGSYLGIGIGNLLNILNPEVVILGGGVFQSAPPLHWKAMLKSCKQHAWPEAFRSAKIVRTKMGDKVGNLGALALVFQ